jgi:hypothetical protein
MEIDNIAKKDFEIFFNIDNDDSKELHKLILETWKKSWF